MLEDAVAVGEFAVFGSDFKRFAVADVDAFDHVDGVFGFCSVCSDVLDGRCAYGAGYAREVFEAVPASFDAEVYEVIPNDAGAGFDESCVFVVFWDVDVFDVGVERDAVEVFEEEQVAAAADVEEFLVFEKSAHQEVS